MLAAVSALFMTGAPAAAQSDDLGRYTPVDPAEYQIPGSPGRGEVWFRTPDGRFCSIALNSGGAGCDAVPIDAPSGANATRVSGTGSAAEYVTSDQPRHTQPEAKVLPEGHKIEWDVTTCGVGFQGTVTCEVRGGQHGFTIAATYGVLH
ncbi:hypothetical protein GCM10027089_35040 [Nocardia thraciensis]